MQMGDRELRSKNADAGWIPAQWAVQKMTQVKSLT
jgi:hypothetical protein